MISTISIMLSNRAIGQLTKTAASRLISRVLLVLLATVILSSCKEELYSQLEERQANEMIYLLESENISVSRERDGDGLNTLLIEREEFARAMAILSKNGLPKESFRGIGEVFGEEKLVTSEFEEKIRYTYALNQELSESLTRIDGVTLARVHITVPEKVRLGKEKPRTKASVFIYYTGNREAVEKKSVIKNLIVNSANNISYEDVTVALFPVKIDGEPKVQKAASSGWLAGLILPLLLLAGAAWLWRSSVKPAPQPNLARLKKLDWGEKQSASREP